MMFWLWFRGLFTVFSFQTTVGVYAYSISNWLALIEAFVLFGLFLKGAGKHSWTYMVAAASVGIALLFTHPYTWDVIVAVLLAYFAWTIVRLHLARGTDGKMHVKQLTLVLGFNLIAYGVYAALPFGRAVSSGGMGFIEHSITFPNLLNLQNGLETMVQMWVGGLYANPLLVFLAVAGMFSIMAFTNRFSRLMFLWVMVPSIALLVVSTENYMFYRIAYVIPLQVLAALGVFWIFSNFENVSRLKGSKLFLLLKIAMLVLVVLFFVNYALRSVDSAPLHILM